MGLALGLQWEKFGTTARKHGDDFRAGAIERKCGTAAPKCGPFSSSSPSDGVAARKIGAAALALCQCSASKLNALKKSPEAQVIIKPSKRNKENTIKS
ncbi:hypothetical protein TIFTF001_029502 [Ficus carica]|uniref:Uncharacterized protein n=1 Tax=Ficus carica TaxID=3494 RepID=A0AA88DW39_FICCA|nr:hypothetical protein TIFTF001_029502 [Ficus carica]